ncbi:MAG: lysine--tRNA ligase, partial [Poseidonia sp.]
MHLSDVMAQRLAERGETHIVATGITPSGEFHIGHLREILTGDMIARAARRAGMEAELVFVVDNADPLRKVYPFLDPEYETFIGHQLGSIPAPDENGKPDWKRFDEEGWTYGDHFLTPFLEALKQIGVTPRLLPNLEAYQSGKFSHAARIACDDRDAVREIIERVSGRELPTDWFPWQPLDSKGSLDGVKVTGYDYPNVHWTDAHGVSGQSNIEQGEGKLPWRLDWPAKWGFNAITCEPFGKDHGAAGGSYDTGKEIARLFGHEPPAPLTYEWISLRGQGAMSSSSGNTVGPIEALRLVPPEILRFLVANSKPSKAIEFDTGMGLVNLADEYERLCARNFEEELTDPDLSRRKRVQIEDAKVALELSVVEEASASVATSVSFRHLALLAQIKPEDTSVWESLQTSGTIDEPSPQLNDRLTRMRSWISSDHFPEEMRIHLCSEPDVTALGELTEDQRSVLPFLEKALQSTPWTTEGITEAFKATATLSEKGMRDVYRASYALFMGSERGPRLAPILSNCDRDEMMELIRQATVL